MYKLQQENADLEILWGLVNVLGPKLKPMKLMSKGDWLNCILLSQCAPVTYYRLNFYCSIRILTMKCQTPDVYRCSMQCMLNFTKLSAVQ